MSQTPEQIVKGLHDSALSACSLVDALLKENESLRSANARLQLEHTELQSENSAAWSEIRDLRSRAAELELSLRETGSTTEAGRLREENELLKRELSSAKTRLDSMQQDLEVLAGIEAKSASLAEAAADARREADAAMSLVASRDAELKRLRPLAHASLAAAAPYSATSNAGGSAPRRSSYVSTTGLGSGDSVSSPAGLGMPSYFRGAAPTAASNSATANSSSPSTILKKDWKTVISEVEQLSRKYVQEQVGVRTP